MPSGNTDQPIAVPPPESMTREELATELVARANHGQRVLTAQDFLVYHGQPVDRIELEDEVRLVRQGRGSLWTLDLLKQKSDVNRG